MKLIHDYEFNNKMENKTNELEFINKVFCSCGCILSKTYHKKHLLTNKHMVLLGIKKIDNKLKKDLENIKTETILLILKSKV